MTNKIATDEIENSDVNSYHPTIISVAKPARFLVMQLQILNEYHYSFL